MNIQEQINNLLNSASGPSNGSTLPPELTPEISQEKLAQIYEEQSRKSFLIGFGSAVLGIFILKGIMK